jgi:hypothetical protein
MGVTIYCGAALGYIKPRLHESQAKNRQLIMFSKCCRNMHRVDETDEVNSSVGNVDPYLLHDLNSLFAAFRRLINGCLVDRGTILYYCMHTRHSSKKPTASIITLSYCMYSYGL